MKLVPAKCPSCGANIQVDDSIGKGFCQYCGSQLIVDEAINLFKGKIEIDNDKKTENYLNRAYQFYDDGMYEEVEKYCNLVLDIDFDNETANRLLKEIKKKITKPNVIISCLDPSSSSKGDSVYVDGKRQNQTINPYGHLTLPVGSWSVIIEASGFKSKPIIVHVTNNKDQYEIKYKRYFMRTAADLIKIK